MALLPTELFDFFSCLQLSQTGKFQIASNQENLQLKPPKVLSLQSALLLMCPPCPTPAGLAAFAGLLHPSNSPLPAQPCPSIHSGRRGSQGELQQRAHLAYSLFLMHFSGCWGHFVLFCSFRKTQSPRLGWSEADFTTRPSSHIPLCGFFHVPLPVLHPVWPNQPMPSSRSPVPEPPVLLGGPGSVGQTWL